MWDQIFRRWIDLVFWWLPKPEAAQQPSAQAPDPAADSPPKPTARDQADHRVSDDLTLIKGIGPVVQQKLHALGIRTFDDLAAADPETLTGQLKGSQPISETLVRGWAEAADQRAAARH